MPSRKHLILFSLIAVVSLCLFLTPVSTAQSSSTITLIDLNGPLTPAMSEYLRRAIQESENLNAITLIMRLDTPGGSIFLMNQMVQDIRASSVPIIVYIAPNGAIAGSAGTVLTLAGHLAIMAPQTAIGAASPVGPQGEDLDSTSQNKANEAVKATMRSLMEGRRPIQAIDLAMQTVDYAKAITASEALKIGMVDYVASDLSTLLSYVNNQTVITKDGPVTLDTRYAIIQEIPPTFIEQLLGALTNPNIVFLLLSIGILAVLTELGSPGGWMAGFIGVLSVTLSAYGLGALGVNWVGLIFLVVAFVLFVLDIKAPTHGALTMTGVGTFITGALILFNSPGTPQFQRASVPLVISTGVMIGGIFLLLLIYALRSIQNPVLINNASIIGRIARVQSELNPTGIIHFSGEQWTAHSVDDINIPPGTTVIVEKSEGNHLWVRQLKE